MGRKQAVEDAFTTAEKPDPNEAVKTVYLGLEVAGKIERLADEWNVSQSRLVRYLLAKSLDLVEKGKLKPPMETRAKLG